MVLVLLGLDFSTFIDIHLLLKDDLGLHRGHGEGDVIDICA